MIDVKEHVYQDDPKVGHPDVRTKLKKVSYFFIGNGLIQGAVQIAPAGEGTPVGLLIMHPERLRKKREALTMDTRNGLEPTTIQIIEARDSSRPKPGPIEAFWSKRHKIPTVCVRWLGRGIRTEEYFSCPEMDAPVILRRVRLKNRSLRTQRLRIRSGVGAGVLEKNLVLSPGREKSLSIRYTLVQGPGTTRILAGFSQKSKPGLDMVKHWTLKSRISFGHPILDLFYQAAKFQLPAVISRTGRVDGGVWQYNREWLRDQAVLALALTMAGDLGLARTMFDRLFDKFVTPDGDTIDSSEKRDPDEVELDQNGFLLYTFKDYVLWTGDVELAKEKWGKIAVTADYPLKNIFRHPASGLLTNRREFWERHRVHGIQPGIELVHQLYTSEGLRAAAILARLLGRAKEAGRWDSEAARIKRAMLDDPNYRMWDDRGFVKRRGLAGEVQETIRAMPDSGLPVGAPLAESIEHFLNPDTSAALPIALGFVPPDSPLCRTTLASLETLWNQGWTGGGYGRYHASSEPDSAGAWPFPSLFVARACVEMRNFKNVWRILKWLDSLPGARAGSWFEFYGKRLSPPFPQVGIVPWNWAEMVILFVHHILGLQPQEHFLRIRPRLLPGLKGVRASFPFRGSRLELDYEKTLKGQAAQFRINGKVLESDEDGGVDLAYCRQNIRVKAKFTF